MARSADSQGFIPCLFQNCDVKPVHFVALAYHIVIKGAGRCDAFAVHDVDHRIDCLAVQLDLHGLSAVQLRVALVAVKRALVGGLDIPEQNRNSAVGIRLNGRHAFEHQPVAVKCARAENFGGGAAPLHLLDMKIRAVCSVNHMFSSSFIMVKLSAPSISESVLPFSQIMWMLPLCKALHNDNYE